jgi:hypothetical protein
MIKQLEHLSVLSDKISGISTGNASNALIKMYNTVLKFEPICGASTVWEIFSFFIICSFRV